MFGCCQWQWTLWEFKQKIQFNIIFFCEKIHRLFTNVRADFHTIWCYIIYKSTFLVTSTVSSLYWAHLRRERSETTSKTFPSLLRYFKLPTVSHFKKLSQQTYLFLFWLSFLVDVVYRTSRQRQEYPEHSQLLLGYVSCHYALVDHLRSCTHHR